MKKSKMLTGSMFAAAFLLSCTASLACWTIDFGDPDGVEGPSCFACSGDRYIACPTNDVCVWAWLQPGWNNCGVQGTITKACDVHSTAAPAVVDSGGCCIKGLYLGKSTTVTAIVTTMVGSGNSP